MERERGVYIRLHMLSCEFCSAELEFYSIYPQLQENVFIQPETIPAPLFELAEALLKNRYGDHRALNMLLSDHERSVFG